ncbi:protein translocase subunit SecD [Candidatus Parcubacteria bacterium]|nr:protein translocase subunit SecD [Candidatus Parcubacteria bacterium]
MRKRKLYLTIGLIFVLAFFCGNFIVPNYWNQTADIVNAKKNEIKYVEKLSNIPQFPEKPFKLGLDLQGGIHLVYEADMSKIAKQDYSSSLQGLRDVIERRVNLFGVQEPIVQVQETPGHYRLIVELAGIKDTSQAIEMIGLTPFLEFKEPKENYQEILENNQKVFETGEGQLEDPFQTTGLTGKYLKKAEMAFDQTTHQPLILLQFDDEGAKIFEDLTTRNIGKPLAVFLDYQLTQAPIVQDKISGGKAQITGDFNIQEAKDRVRELNTGALPVPISLISQQSVGPILGKISLEKSLKAGIIGFLAVIIFLILFYRLPGFLASLSLGVFIGIVLVLFKLIPVTLTLAGIGGAILSIGMAIDANILIFSRMREEMKEGKGFIQSVEQGFERAWSSIRDGNLTTLLVALILFAFGTSFIKGFALVLSLGILISMFSAIFITKNFLKVFEGTRLENIKWLWR